MYKVVPLKQRSYEWLEWKKGKLGSSDASAIKNKSEYNTPFSLWNKKMFDVQTDLNSAMQRGIDLEPYALQWAMQKLGCPLSDVCLESTQDPWRIASLDGWCQDIRCFTEIKCNRRVYHEMAQDGVIPEEHIYQMYHDFIVWPDAFHGWYVSVSPKADKNNMDCVLVEMPKPSPEILLDLKEAEDDFFDLMVKCEPPEPTDRDLATISDPMALEIASEYAKVSETLSELEKRKKEYRSKLIGLCDKSSLIGDLRIVKFPKRGNVDYSKIPELSNINLNMYRKPTSTQWRIS